MTDHAHNPSVVAAESAVDLAVMQFAMRASIEAAKTALPWLRLPIVSQLFDWATSLVFGFMNTLLKRVAANSVIDAQVNGQENAVTKAKTDLKNAHVSGDPNAIEKASQDFDAAFGRLVHWDGG